jgi:hypothetical protein
MMRLAAVTSKVHLEAGAFSGKVNWFSVRKCDQHDNPEAAPGHAITANARTAH